MIAMIVQLFTPPNSATEDPSSAINRARILEQNHSIHYLSIIISSILVALVVLGGFEGIVEEIYKFEISVNNLSSTISTSFYGFVEVTSKFRKLVAWISFIDMMCLIGPMLPFLSNSGVTCEDEAKRHNSGAKMKTFEENCYLLLYAVSNKEDMAYQRQLIIRLRVKDQFPIRRITLHLYAVCTAGHQSKICN
ncbi:hypothetical protein Tco_0627054 [Tanacetum coccineum]|uniref:Ion transport domain-containing protein n=1 Tax=Tanacetum coccineum TaxID=301880 RepID=A0ABQ4WLF0_9ASTR